MKRLPGTKCLAPAIYLTFCGAALSAGITVTLTPSPAGPQPVGTTITWTANITDPSGGVHESQFSVGSAILRDFNLTNSFQWTPSQREGTYTVSVIVRNDSTGQTAKMAANVIITSRLVGGRAAVNATAHPLVALFSAPPCGAGNFIRVRFHAVSGTLTQTTNSIACSPVHSENFYIAGMTAGTQYQMHFETLTGTGTLVQAGSDLHFTTGTVPSAVFIPAVSVLSTAILPTSATYPILLHGYLPIGSSGQMPVPAATDLNGNPLWYYPHPVSLMTRTEAGGNMFVLFVGTTDPHYQILREIDLAGNTVHETNVSRVNEQLLLAGKRTVNAFHHEARRLKNGYIAVLGSDEMLVTNAQGGTPNKPVDVLGAQVIVLDTNLQLVWSWDAFNYLDLNRAAILGETCVAGKIGCPVFFLAKVANDWLHANSIQEAPDGSMILSLRHQDWVIKIDYADGTGTGRVYWRMGAGGDFIINSNDPCPWFSHQHDANFEGNMTVLSMFDNGNTRKALCNPNGESRGYVLSVDESATQVTPMLLTDLGVFSTGLGTAELLSNGNYHFESGWIVPGSYSNSIELTPYGSTAFSMREFALTYRSYRMQDLYTPGLQ